MGRQDPENVEEYDRRLAEVTIGGARPLTGPIEIHDYDPAWPALYGREAARIRSALGGRVVRLEHVGSTSVPGLPAKPVIDVGLEVPDSAAEAAYVPDLEAAGYVLRIREPEWFEHRLFNGPDVDVNLHVFPANCEELDRMLLFRDRLRANAADRVRYAAAKRELAARRWKYTQQYADAKSDVVRSILAAAERPSIYEFAGGEAAFLALAHAHHQRCLDDPELNHPFSHPGQPDHIERLASYWAEVFGGPPRYSERWGGQSAMIDVHAGQGHGEGWDERFVACFVGAADDAGLPDDPEFRAALRDYMRWAVADVLSYSPEGSSVPAGLAVPRWGWDGAMAGTGGTSDDQRPGSP